VSVKPPPKKITRLRRAAGLIEKETQNFTVEFAENAEKKTLNNLCVLSDLCGEIHLGMQSHNNYGTTDIFASRIMMSGRDGQSHG
jgi:hypothetical protein